SEPNRSRRTATSAGAVPGSREVTCPRRSVDAAHPVDRNLFDDELLLDQCLLGPAVLLLVDVGGWGHRLGVHGSHVTYPGVTATPRAPRCDSARAPRRSAGAHRAYARCQSFQTGS